ncbi:Type I secretion outer membrane, TolC family protein [Sphingomonas paucimobilis]|nr:Type I secretion outer membrane, TolC family protein [Sphingomonas paucimobilis]
MDRKGATGIKIATLVLLATTSVGTIRAETMGEAIADAYRNNPRLQAQRAQLRVLDETVIQAASPYRLQMGVSGNLSYTNQRQRPIPGAEFQTFTNKNFGVALTASQILLNGGRTAAQVSAAEADVLGGRELLRNTENQILLEVIDSYIAVRRDQEIVAIQRRSVDSYSRQVQQAQARERGGDLTRTDIAQAEAQLGIVRTQLSQAEAQLEQSRARFATVVGRNPTTLEPEPPLPGLPVNMAEAYRLAETDSPAIMEAVLNERAGRARVSAERAARRPVVAVQGSYGYVSPQSYETRDLGRGYSADVTLTIPLLTQGIVDSRVRQAIANRQSLTFTIEDTRRTVNASLLNSWNQSVTARDQLDIGENTVRAAEAALVGVRNGFAEGFRSNFEVLDSEQRLLTAQVLVAQARYARYAGQASLLATLGRLEGAALEQANRYDEAANLKRQRSRQFGPFQMILQPIDKLSRPGGQSQAAPIIDPWSDTSVRAAVTPPPAGPVTRTSPVRAATPGQTLPLDTRDRLPVLPPTSRKVTPSDTVQPVD